MATCIGHILSLGHMICRKESDKHVLLRERDRETEKEKERDRERKKKERERERDRESAIYVFTWCSSVQPP